MANFELDRKIFLHGVDIGRRLRALRNRHTAYVYSDLSLVFRNDSRRDPLKTVLAVCIGWIDRYYSGYGLTPWYKSGVKLTSVVIEDDVQPENTASWFSYQSNLVDVKLGSRIETIGASMFTSCAALPSIVIPDSVTTIQSYAFERCTSLLSVTMSRNVETIARDAFYYTAIRSVNLPETLHTLGYGAFRYCPNLNSITLPEAVTVVPDSCFSNCTGLVQVHIGSHTTTLSKYAFYSCSSLEYITIPASVTELIGNTFAGCTSLKGIIFEDPKGWWYTSDVDATSGTSVNFSNYTNNINYLVTAYGSTYYNYYFRKS